jgi:hypothetical protein
MGEIVGEAKGSFGGRALAVVAWILALVPGVYGLSIVFDAPGHVGWDTGSRVAGVVIGLMGLAAAVFLCRAGIRLWKGAPGGGKRVGLWIGLGFLWLLGPGFVYAASNW